MNIVIVGAGAIGRERIKALSVLGEKIIAVVDPLMPNLDYPVYHDLFETFADFSKIYKKRADWVFVCTPHDVTKNILLSHFLKGINVLVEKPLGRTLKEANEIYIKSPAENIYVGFNYRFYKGINLLLQDVFAKKFGDLISVNMVLGLSNSPGTEKTWRLDPLRAGSGSMIYSGIHLIDLAMLISEGTLYCEKGLPWSGFWGTGIEEEAHILATDKNNTIYNIQSSINRWRSILRIEVNGTDGYGIVEGRNRNYGNQTYRRGKRWGWMTGKQQKETEEIIVDYNGEDSFIEETKAVLYGTDSIIKPGTQLDNKNCLEFIETIF